MHEARSTADLSADDIRKFQALLRQEIGRHPSADETGRIVERLLRLYRQCETAGKTLRPATETPRVLLGGRPATQRNLEIEATLALRTLQEHLRHAEQRASTWRWAIVALHSALKYSLQAGLVADGSAGQLTEDVPMLFRRVGDIMPELPQMGEAVQQLDRLRWNYLTKQLSLWPAKAKDLVLMATVSLRLVQRLRDKPEDALMEGLTAMLEG